MTTNNLAPNLVMNGLLFYITQVPTKHDYVPFSYQLIKQDNFRYLLHETMAIVDDNSMLSKSEGCFSVTFNFSFTHLS